MVWTASVSTMPCAPCCTLCAHAFAWQFAGYVLGSVEVGWALAALNHPASPAACVLCIEALTQAARNAVFIAPAGLGVQEGTIVAVAALFGIDREAVLSFAMVRRARIRMGRHRARVDAYFRRTPQAFIDVAVSELLILADQTHCVAQSIAASKRRMPDSERFVNVSLPRKNITRRAGASDS